MPRIACFWLEPTNFAERSLRRYASAKCPGPFGYHNSSLVIEDEVAFPLDEARITGRGDLHWPRDDRRWPVSCPCGYQFGPEDEWQHNLDRLYDRTDGGPRTTLGRAPVGAMWNASWWPGDRGPDGQCLVVKTPAGEWMIDGPSKGGGRWTRTGTPPRITVTPSIGIGEPFRYHGWLRDGFLEDA